jgi:phosphoribosylformylglycinamidine synthase subunit PurQ / glutaminase
MRSTVKFGVVVFPGSNCDHDAYHAVKHVIGEEVVFLWHKDSDLQGVDVVILPGGFSYGDYLRCGSIARFSPIMTEVVRFARRGGYVLGICNGFQILTETGLLPGALLRNTSLNFVCRTVTLRTENTDTPFTHALPAGLLLKVPVAHGEGNYHTDPETLERLEAERRIVFRYCDPEGYLTSESNPNGSMHNIAGIINQEGNVLGMMPHPERSMELLLGSHDGIGIFQSLVHSVRQDERVLA